MTAPAGIVLVGGASTRMGTDKAALIVDGVAMGERAADVLKQSGIQEVLIAGGPDLPDPDTEEGRQGPLAGVVAGWRALQSGSQDWDPVVVLSCDLPAITAEVVRRLVEAAARSAHGAIAHDGDRPQPLVAAYRPEALDALELHFVAGGRSLRNHVEQWSMSIVNFDPALVTDADRPEDLVGFDVEWPG